ncbi:MAG: 2-hydroxyacyl-CoA dehydratase [Actinomycetota bacterium]|nr:2-hydroxyacyl-CoA dehydratase [Actinomycetota bacterium]
MAKIGITTTVPIEVIYAAGHEPVDLNNAFVSHTDSGGLVEKAELAGFPRNFCAWIKGIYGAVETLGDIDAVVAVTQGDCSNTHALMETLQMECMEVIPFAYPYERDRDILEVQMEKLMRRMGVDWNASLEAMESLDRVRSKAHEIDRLTWEEGTISGYENHIYLVSCSDMEGHVQAFDAKLKGFLERIGDHSGGGGSDGTWVRLGYVGVPPMTAEIYQYLESLGARVFFNEVQRQFSLPFQTRDLVEKYILYTYPYSIFYRMEDIAREVERRRLVGLIHYVQSFCFRQVEDIILRRRMRVPVLTVEMDRSTLLDARTKMRLENFVSMLRGRSGS